MFSTNNGDYSYTLENGEKWNLNSFDYSNRDRTVYLQVSPECTSDGIRGCTNSIDYYKAQINEVLKKIGKLHVSLLGTFKK